MTKLSYRKIVLATLAYCTMALAFNDSAFKPGNVWGWGGDASYKAQVLDKKHASLADSSQANLSKTDSASAATDTVSQKIQEIGFSESVPTAQVYIPFFDEYIGSLLLQKDFKTLANADSIRTNQRRLATAHGNLFSRSAPTEESEKILQDVYIYLSSSAWEGDLQKLDAGDAAFIRAIVYSSFMSELVTKRYIQILIDRIQNGDQQKYLEETFNVKPTREALHQNYGYMIIPGIGVNFFSNGAEDFLGPHQTFRFGFGYCLDGMYCLEFGMAGSLMHPIKEDIVQSDITYAADDISYTILEILIRTKVISTYDYSFSVFGGFHLQAIEIGPEQNKEYKDLFGKGMKNDYSCEFTTGISGTKYFFGNDYQPKLGGLSLRLGVATINDSEFDISGLNWYGGIELIIRLMLNPK